MEFFKNSDKHAVRKFYENPSKITSTRNKKLESKVEKSQFRID